MPLERDLRAMFRPPLGVPVSFGGGNTYSDGSPVCGIYDRVAKDAGFGSASVGDAEHTLQLPFNAFDPAPRSKQTIQILDGFGRGNYTIRSVNPLDDGMTIELQLETAS